MPRKRLLRVSSLLLCCRCSFERSAASGATLRVGVYAATFGVNFPAKAAECAADRVVVQTLPGMAAASASATGEVDISEAVAALRQMADAGCGLRIVCVHWGHEFEGYPTVPQMAVARALARAGADIVLGAHAHVAQPAEVLLLNGYTGQDDAEARALRNVPPCCRMDGAPGPPRKALVLYCLGAHMYSCSRPYSCGRACGCFSARMTRAVCAGCPLVAWQATSAAQCSMSFAAWARCLRCR